MAPPSKAFRARWSFFLRALSDVRGPKPTLIACDIPVQLRTKYDLVVNLKIAKVLDFTVPLVLLASADEVIE
jgi:putative tryptophan/tyrosine transport system substrate-binding protein